MGEFIFSFSPKQEVYASKKKKKKKVVLTHCLSKQHTESKEGRSQEETQKA